MITFELENKKVSIPENLLERYNRMGPRYTSYPTAPEWSAGVGEDDYRRTLRLDRLKNEDLTLYTHLPFCERACYFCGCHTVITRKHELAETYLDFLEKEIDTLGGLLEKKGRAVQMQWGGGTPTYLTSEQLERLFGMFKRNFQFSPWGENSIEIHPHVTRNEQIETLRRLGFNRISMGVQDFDPRVQKAVNRTETRERVEELISFCRSLGFRSINLDLIYGLPLQTPESFEKTIDAIITLSPDRIALFNYAHVPSMKPFQKYINEADLPAGRVKFDIFRMATGKLTAAGYIFVGLDHFAKPDDELVRAQKDQTLKRDFMGYTTHAGTNLLGIGESAIGMMNDIYVQNEKKHARYQQRIASNGLAIVRGFRLSPDDLLRRGVIMNILCHMALDYAEIEERFGISFGDYFSEELSRLPAFADDGVILFDGRGFTVTPLGRIFVRNIAMIFDAYLRKPAQEKRLFSRTL